MYQIAPGWGLEVERGPDCLFIKLEETPEPSSSDFPELANVILELLEQHFAHRLVVECESLPTINNHLIEEFVALQKGVETRGGLLRLCGLSEENQAALRKSSEGDCVPHYRDRYEAVGTHHPNLPR
ncbi:MAG: hypothetical protein N2C14_19170 [Planctomycetales bacterium]